MTTYFKITQIALLVVLSVICNIAYPQASTAPHIAYVYPAGGQKGSTFTVIIGGANLKSVDSVVFSQKGISATVKECISPPRNAQNAVRNKYEKILVKKDDQLAKKIEELGAKEGLKYLQSQLKQNPDYIAENKEADIMDLLYGMSSEALAQTVEIEVTIADDAELSDGSIMLSGTNGLSNPAKFIVGKLPEVSKPSLRKATIEWARLEENYGKAKSKYNARKWQANAPQNNTPIEIDLPVVVNGQITEGNTDFWKFSAKKGQKIVMSVSAQTILPYISDGVPGWFQTVIRVCDSNGNEVAFNDDFHHRPDSYLVFKVPFNDEFTVEIFDAVHRSREDFVYRMLIGEVPFVESVFPQTIQAGQNNIIELVGVNLKSNKMLLKTDLTGNIEFKSDKVFYKSIPLYSTKKPVEFSAQETARRTGESFKDDSKTLKIPSTVNGRLESENDIDSYKFDLPHGHKIVAEIFARRYDSALDSYIVIQDATGKVLAKADDFEDLSYGYVTHHADSRLEFTSPATGTYFLRVLDTTGVGSASHSYRLEVSKGNGDYSVCGSSSTLNTRSGGSVLINLKAFRKNGFDKQIKVFPKKLPAGWSYSGGIIDADKDDGYLVISSKFGNSYVDSFELNSVAELDDDKKIYRKVIPSEYVMQAFYYMHYLPFDKFYVQTGVLDSIRKLAKSVRFQMPKNTIKIPLGSKKSVRIANTGVKGGKPIGEILNDDKIIIESFYQNKNDYFFVLKADEQKAKVGDKGSVIALYNIQRGAKFYNVDVLPSFDYEIVEPIKPKEEQKNN